jgi:hypothetical protein
MNKKIIAGVAVGLIILAVGALAFMYQKDGTTLPSADIQEAKSLKELLSMNSPQQCSFEYADEQSKTSGKVYLANGKMKGEFKTNYNNQETTSYMVIKEDTLYAWENNSTSGISVPLKEYWESQENEDIKTPVKADEKVNYKCSAWMDQDEAFGLPSDVEFTSFQEMIDQAMEAQTKMMQDSGIDCSVCDQVPAGSAQDQCKAALGC